MAKGKYQEWLTEDGLLTIEGYARDGLTDKDIAEKKIGVSESTFSSWKVRFSVISETLKKGRKPVAEKVENSLYDLCQVQEYTDTIIEEYQDAKGNVTGRHIRKTKRQVAPNPTAIIFALKNLKPDKWREKQDLNINAKHEGKLADLIEGLKENDIYTETTASDEAVADEQTEKN